MDIAASLQVVTEEVMLKMSRYVRKLTGMKSLCLAGGVALNCVGNGKILKERVFDDLWIQPAAGDAGGAAGVALCIWHKVLKNERKVVKGKDSMKGSYLGPKYDSNTIREYLDKNNFPYIQYDDDQELIQTVVGYLKDEKVAGWFQGRMEFGPRSLGGRSILGDPRSPRMQSIMNLKIKFRESFRPFAPSVQEEKVSDWFEMDCKSPYMLLVAQVREDKRIALTEEQKKLFGIDLLNVPRSQLPSITHVDYSARVQTVGPDNNPRFYNLLKTFGMQTDCPVLINTSFNVRGEPIVCTPEQAYLCFMRTEMDFLVLENLVLLKPEQTPLDNDTDWRDEFELD